MTKAFSKCYLHIGVEKTGTTTLQYFLGANRMGMARDGFFIPRSLSPYDKIANHERLTTMSLRTDKLADDLRVAAGLRSKEDVFQHRLSTADLFADEVGALDPSLSTLLLSNEHCHSRLVLDEEVQRLREFLLPYCESFNVVVYLRAQHELATSLYTQALRAGYCDIDILPSFGPSGEGAWIERRYFDYDDLLTRWGNVFGAESLYPRVYSEADLRAGDIVADFLSVIGCTAKDLLVAPDQNVTISAHLQPALNAINRFVKANPSSLPPLLRFKLISKLESMSTGGGHRPRRADAIAFFEGFAASNEAVRMAYFPERKQLFDLSFKNYPDHSLQTDGEIQALVKLVLDTL